MNLAEQIAAKKSEAAQILAKGVENLSDEEINKAETLTAEVKELGEKMDKYKGLQSQLDAVANTTPAKHVTAEPQAKSLGEHFAMQVKEHGGNLKELAERTFNVSEFKAAGDTHVEGGVLDPLLTQIDGNPVLPYARPLLVADLFGQGTVAGTAIKYPVFGEIEGSTASRTEKGTTVKVHVGNPTWVTESVTDIAAMYDISEDMAEDLPYITSLINDAVIYNLKTVEEEQLLNGTGASNTLKGLLTRTGVQTLAKAKDSDADRIFKAFTLIQNATGFAPDGIIINPSDYEALRLTRDSNGQYYGGGYFAGQYGNSGMVQNPPLWGVRTVVTSAVAKGTVVVGAFAQGARVLRNGGLRATATTSNGTNFEQGIISLRVRERVGLEVRYPKAFVNVTLGQSV